MEATQKESIEKQKAHLQARIAFSDQVATEAATNMYWHMAKFARNDCALARAELRGLDLLLKNDLPSY
jgi:hypothetical protein